MKKTTISLLSLIAIMSIVWGCAPSVTVTQAGHAKQFEVTVSSNDFGFAESQELIDELETLVEKVEDAETACGAQGRKVGSE